MSEDKKKVSIYINKESDYDIYNFVQNLNCKKMKYVKYLIEQDMRRKDEKNK